MKLNFTKMHGLGNDFVVIDGINQDVKLSKQQIQKLSDRHFGIGFDQLLLVQSARNQQSDFYYRIFNADGGEVEQCGNGARCFAYFVKEKNLCDKSTIKVETMRGILTLQLTEDEQVQVAMGIPSFQPSDVPFISQSVADFYDIAIADKRYDLSILAIGNPHAVLRVKDVSRYPVDNIGPIIAAQPCFPNSVNVGFMQVIDEKNINLRVYERGTGETLACGSGACAAVVAGIRRGWLNDKVTVSLPGGELKIAWKGEGEQVMMTGPATNVFDGIVII